MKADKERRKGESSRNLQVVLEVMLTLAFLEGGGCAMHRRKGIVGIDIECVTALMQLEMCPKWYLCNLNSSEITIVTLVTKEGEPEPLLNQ